MENFEFKSQICTTRSQSETLIKLGLKKETADMTIVKFGELYCEFVGEVEISCGTIRMNGKEIDNNVKEHIPAWSLHRLIEMYTERYLACSVNLKIFTYEWLINEIEIHIKEGDFNQDYLEEKL